MRLERSLVRQLWASSRSRNALDRRAVDPSHGRAGPKHRERTGASRGNPIIGEPARPLGDRRTPSSNFRWTTDLDREGPWMVRRLRFEPVIGRDAREARGAKAAKTATLRRGPRPGGSIKGSIPTARWRLYKSRRNKKRRFAALLQSPLTDSNRRPPPYHEREEGVDSRGIQRSDARGGCRGSPRLVAFCVFVRPWCDPPPVHDTHVGLLSGA
jgi:hypothetical protein